MILLSGKVTLALEGSYDEAAMVSRVRTGWNLRRDGLWTTRPLGHLESDVADAVFASSQLKRQGKSSGDGWAYWERSASGRWDRGSGETRGAAGRNRVPSNLLSNIIGMLVSAMVSR